MARALTILLVEDNEDDRTLFERAASETIGSNHNFCIVAGAREAIQLLQEQLTHNLPLPHLLLIDLKMPGMDGFQFLSWLRERPEFRALPAVAYSGSILQQDVDRAYQHGAISYVAKPMRFEDLTSTIKTLVDYWSGCALPVASV